MAISWGGYATILGVRLRAGVEHTVSPSNPSPSTTSVTVTTRIYLGVAPNSYGWGNGTWEAYTDASGSGSFSWNLNGGQSALAGTVTTTVPLIYGQTQTFNAGGRVRPFTSSTSTVNRGATVTIPARPIQSPNAPSGLAGTRVNDRQHNLSWTNNALSGRPYGNVEVWRSTNGGSFVRVANLSGSTTSWSDTGTQANARYAWRVRAMNAAGASGWSGTVTFDTTPATPSAPSAAKNAAGDIVVTRPAYSMPATTWEVRDNGGNVLATGLTATTWIHENPSPTQTWRYQIRTRSNSPALFSSWSGLSNTVQLAAPPAAPTQLDPNGTTKNATETIQVTWRYNSTDTSPQRQYQIRYRVVGVSTWTTPAASTSSTSQHTFPADTFTNGDDIEWQVRTWGQHPDPSPYSATAIMRLAERPTVGIVEPTPGTVLNSPQRTFQWSYYQPQGYAQSMWQVEIRRDNVVVKSHIDDGAATSWNSGRVFEDGETYVFRVRAADSNGVWSTWTSATYSVAFTGPLPPLVTAEWQTAGHVRLYLTSVDSSGPEPNTLSLTLERSIDGGPWQLLAENLPDGTEYLDWTAHSRGTNRYRVTAVSALPSYTSVETTVVTEEDCTIYLGAGPDYAVTAKMDLIDTTDLESGRTRAANRYIGREFPVEVSGLERNLSLSLTARHLPQPDCWSDTPPIEHLQTIFDMPGPHLYRDGEGRYMFVTVSPLSIQEKYLGEITFSVTKSTAPTLEAIGEILSYVGPVIVQVAPGEYRIYGGTTHGPGPGEWLWTP